MTQNSSPDAAPGSVEHAAFITESLGSLRPHLERAQANAQPGASNPLLPAILATVVAYLDFEAGVGRPRPPHDDADRAITGVKLETSDLSGAAAGGSSQQGPVYVVFNGRLPGVYDDSYAASAQITGIPKAAMKRYATRAAGVAAFEKGQATGLVFVNLG